MALCVYFEVIAEDSKIAIRAAKDNVEEMIKKENFNKEQLNEIEFDLKFNLDRLIADLENTPPHLIFQVEALREYVCQIFANVTGEIDETKLHKLSNELETLFQMIVEVSVLPPFHAEGEFFSYKNIIQSFSHFPKSDIWIYSKSDILKQEIRENKTARRILKLVQYMFKCS